jgi:2,4-dienoyl-CoA reductase-like NADH-dependent reductase (Old Yellow Enzyme family)
MTIGSIGLQKDVTASFKGDLATPAPLTELVRRFDRGDFDLAGIGRVLLADPQWIEKVREGRFADLQPFESSAAKVVY